MRLWGTKILRSLPQPLQGSYRHSGAISIAVADNTQKWPLRTPGIPWQSSYLGEFFSDDLDLLLSHWASPGLWFLTNGRSSHAGTGLQMAIR